MIDLARQSVRPIPDGGGGGGGGQLVRSSAAGRHRDGARRPNRQRQTMAHGDSTDARAPRLYRHSCTPALPTLGHSDRTTGVLGVLSSTERPFSHHSPPPPPPPSRRQEGPHSFPATPSNERLSRLTGCNTTAAAPAPAAAPARRRCRQALTPFASAPAGRGRSDGASVLIRAIRWKGRLIKVTGSNDPMLRGR